MDTGKKEEMLHNRFHGDFWKHSNRTWVFFYSLIILFITIKPWEPDYTFLKSIVITGVGGFLIYSSFKEIAFAEDFIKLRDEIIGNPLDKLRILAHKRFRKRSRFDNQLRIMIIIIIGSSFISLVLNTKPLQWCILRSILWSKLWSIPFYISLFTCIYLWIRYHKTIPREAEGNK